MGGSAIYERVAGGQAVTTTSAWPLYTPATTFRVAPTVSYSGSWALSSASSAALAVTSIAADAFSPQALNMLVTVASGLVAGDATQLFSNNNTTARLTFDAEL